PIDSVKDLSI
ncbi:hypothetical protein SOVF_157580, partial [Spinacia oleracea]